MAKTKIFWPKHHNNKLVIYLHGGPFFEIKSRYDDPIIMRLLNQNFVVVAINYLDDIEEHLENKIWGRGGEYDLMICYEEISKIIVANKEMTIYLVGESYGGFLASILSSNNFDIEKIVIISGFISITYQLLFSSEYIWLNRLLSKKSRDFWSIIEDVKINTVFIHGELDQACPIKQFDLISERFKVNRLIDFKHRETGKKLKTVYDLVIDELNSSSENLDKMHNF